MIEFELHRNKHWRFIGPIHLANRPKSLNADVTVWLRVNSAAYEVELMRLCPTIRFKDPRQATMFKMVWL
jgi:hypothetical protein